LQGVEAGAAAHDLTEALAEMAERRITDFEGGFGDVVFAGLEEFGGAFHAEFAQVLGNGHAGLGGKGAAKVEGTASDFAPNLLEGKGFDEILAQKPDDLIDAFAGDALLAIAEIFIRPAALKKEFGHQFEDLALEPKETRALQDGWLKQIGNALFLRGGEAMDFAEMGAGIPVEKGFDQRMKGAITKREAFAEKVGGKFDGDEAMMVGGAAPGLQLVVAGQVKAGGHRSEIHARSAIANGSVAVEIEAKFEAVGMKTAGPLKAGGQLEIVPLDANPHFIKASVKLAPAVMDGTPHDGFLQTQDIGPARSRRIHSSVTEFGGGSISHAI